MCAMHKMKWIITLLLASALCTACDTRNEAVVSGGKEPAGKVAASEPAAYDAEKIALAKKNNCFSCHSIEKKMIGPAWKDVAAKYRGAAGAEERLISNVSRGSSGVWGSIPMPANSPAVTDADIQALVKFALSL